MSLSASVTVASAGELDSLFYESDGEVLYVNFLLPLAALKSAGIEEAIDDQGLTVECLVSIEVQKSRKFGSDIVSKSPINRTLKYSKWYQEYVACEKAREIFTGSSYYKALDTFRRFAGVPVIDLYFLEPGEQYAVTLTVAVRAQAGVQQKPGTAVAIASMAPGVQGQIASDLTEILHKKSDFLSAKVVTGKFTSDALPQPLHRRGP